MVQRNCGGHKVEGPPWMSHKSVASEVGTAQGGYNGPCVVGDFKRQMTGILNISHLCHSPNATSRSALSAKFPQSAISLRKMALWIISRF